MRVMKDSGVEWIGVIPNLWHIKKVKYLFEIVKRIAGSEGFDILSVTQKGLKIKDISSGEGQIAENYSNYQFVYPNDFVMNHMDLLTGWVDVSQLFGVTSPDYRVFRLLDRELHNIGYFKYVMQNCYLNRIFYSLGQGVSSMGRWRLQTFVFNNFDIPIPPLTEQRAIANYLDTKCAEIDALMEDIRAEISTLEEYKKSAITEAVTKGLNPDVKMKDSGVPWVGKCPEHWHLQKGKYILKLLQKPVLESDGVITCFRDGEVTLRSKRREEGFTIAEKEHGYQGVDIGDLVVHGMDGFAGAIGISDSRGKASPVLNVLDTEQDKLFVMFYLRSMAYGNIFLAMATGIRVRSCDLRWNKLAELRYPVPPLQEQREISRYLVSKCAEIDSTISDKREQLSVLEEYKKSLIYEYVTGKKEVPAP